MPSQRTISLYRSTLRYRLRLEKTTPTRAALARIRLTRMAPCPGPLAIRPRKALYRTLRRPLNIRPKRGTRNNKTFPIHNKLVALEISAPKWLARHTTPPTLSLELERSSRRNSLRRRRTLTRNRIRSSLPFVGCKLTSKARRSLRCYWDVLTVG